MSIFFPVTDLKELTFSQIYSTWKHKDLQDFLKIYLVYRGCAGCYYVWIFHYYNMTVNLENGSRLQPQK